MLKKLPKKYKDIIIIDTDDIDDPNSLKAIKKYSFKNKKKDINAIIENNKNKIIIFAGFLHAGMQHIEKKVDKGYMIDITPEKLWRQYNLRTVTYIHKNYNEIKKLLNSRIDPTKIHIIFNRTIKKRC